jgi:glutamate dehydrogenase/leucine dehydrogenase
VGDGIFELLGDEFEQVVHIHDPQVGLRAIVAVHSTVLGPSCGGTRFRPYPGEREALIDVLRLARGMTYKHAVAGLDFGGGKAVILGDPHHVRTDQLMRCYGRHLHRLGGSYLTAEDVGTTQADMDLLKQETPHVTGASEALGGSGDPSPATAWGVLHAVKAAAGSIEGLRVVVSGVGKVGSALVGHLAAGGAQVAVADVDEVAVKRMVSDHGVETIAPDDAHRVTADVFSPCALGAVLSEATIPELGASIVCGAANNQLATEADGARLADAGVTYVPDYVANAGGVINIAEEFHPDGYDRQRALDRVTGIGPTVRRVLDMAAEGIPTAAAADRIAEARLDAAKDRARP